MLLFYCSGYLSESVGRYIDGIRVDNGDWQLDLEVDVEGYGNLNMDEKAYAKKSARFNRNQASRQCELTSSEVF